MRTSKPIKIAKRLKSQWRSYQDTWRGCQRCPLHEDRCKIVHYRGWLPAPILFIGEAPGMGEDDIGLPFVGPAGSLFDEIVEAAGITRYAVTNVTGCIPLAGNGKIRAPNKKEAAACHPRLQAIAEMAEPKLIITVGKVSKTYLPNINQLRHRPIIRGITHPSGMLRAPDSRQDILKKRAILSLKEWVQRAY